MGSAPCRGSEADVEALASSSWTLPAQVEVSAVVTSLMVQEGSRVMPQSARGRGVGVGVGVAALGEAVALAKMFLLFEDRETRRWVHKQHARGRRRPIGWISINGSDGEVCACLQSRIRWGECDARCEWAADGRLCPLSLFVTQYDLGEKRSNEGSREQSD